MKPEIGVVYERYVVKGSFWNCERRLVLDVTDTQVFYEELTNPPLQDFGIIDTTKARKQVSIRKWRVWARLAREPLTK